MQQDLSTGFYTISVMEGGTDALDPRSTATMEQVKTCHDRSIPHGSHQGELSLLIRNRANRMG